VNQFWSELADEQRRAAIIEAEYQTGIASKLIEKDWWVSVTLRALFSGKFAQHLVFKGGTSLSKCWKLINRFSEDIDIALSPSAVGFRMESNPSKNFVEQLRRAGCRFTSEKLLDELRYQFDLYGIRADVIAENVLQTRPDTDPQTSLFVTGLFLNRTATSPMT